MTDAQIIIQELSWLAFYLTVVVGAVVTMVGAIMCLHDYSRNKKEGNIDG